MERFKFLKHTADARMQAFGKNLEEAFVNAALGMFSLMTDTEKVEGKIEKRVFAEGKDTKALLYNWLEELLFLLDSEGFLLHRVKSISMGDNSIEAVVAGDKATLKYTTHGEVKAVTYNEMDISKEKGRIVVQVVLDL